MTMIKENPPPRLLLISCLTKSCHMKQKQMNIGFLNWQEKVVKTPEFLDVSTRLNDKIVVVLKETIIIVLQVVHGAILWLY
jgi:hypothetical protein